jgi:hypothetical protein
VTLFNRAAELILGVPSQHALQRIYHETLPLASDLRPGIDEVKQNHSVVSREVERVLPARGKVELSVNFAPLRGETDGDVSGVALVMEDLTSAPQPSSASSGHVQAYAPPAVGAIAARSLTVETPRHPQADYDLVLRHSRLHCLASAWLQKSWWKC